MSKKKHGPRFLYPDTFGWYPDESNNEHLHGSLCAEDAVEEFKPYVKRRLEEFNHIQEASNFIALLQSDLETYLDSTLEFHEQVSDWLEDIKLMNAPLGTAAYKFQVGFPDDGNDDQDEVSHV